jgi:hypothetical protein
MSSEHDGVTVKSIKEQLHRVCRTTLTARAYILHHARDRMALPQETRSIYVLKMILGMFWQAQPPPPGR